MGPGVTAVLVPGCLRGRLRALTTGHLRGTGEHSRDWAVEKAIARGLDPREPLPGVGPADCLPGDAWGGHDVAAAPKPARGAGVLRLADLAECRNRGGGEALDAGQGAAWAPGSGPAHAPGLT